MTTYIPRLDADEVMRLAAQGLNLDEIAARLETNKARVRGFCRSRGIDYTRQRSFWTPEREAQAWELRRQGVTPTESAKLMGCTRSALVAKLHALKLAEGAKKGREVVREAPTLVSDVPPSAAMLRLAAFDPIVRRALHVRQGLPIEED